MARAAKLSLALLLLLLCGAARAQCTCPFKTFGDLSRYEYCTTGAGSWTDSTKWCNHGAGDAEAPASNVANRDIGVFHAMTFSSGLWKLASTSEIGIELNGQITIGGNFDLSGWVSVKGLQGFVVSSTGYVVVRSGVLLDILSSEGNGFVQIATGGTLNFLTGSSINGAAGSGYSCHGGSGPFSATCNPDSFSCCGSGSCASGECSVCAICGDPHFVGIDGVRYNYMGSPNRIISLISDRIVQVNSLFASYGDPKRNITVMTSMGFRVCDHTLAIYANGSVYADAKLVAYNNSHAPVALSPALSYRFQSAKTVAVRFGTWRAVVAINAGFMNLMTVQHLDDTDLHIHGAYGVTGRPDHHQKDTKKCQPSLEGGCELPGKWQDYELPSGAPLLSTEWAYTQYDAAQCAKLVDEAAKVQQGTDDVLAARIAAAKKLSTPVHK